MIKLKIGDSVKVVSNKGMHNYKIGEIYKIVNISGIGYILSQGGNYIYDLDIKVIYTKDILNTIIKDLNQELISLKEKEQFLNDLGVDECDEKTFIIDKIINIANDDKSKKDKILLIQKYL